MRLSPIEKKAGLSSLHDVMGLIVEAALKLHRGHFCVRGIRLGRPVVHVNVEQVKLLRSQGATWQSISDTMKIPRGTLYGAYKAASVVSINPA